MKNPLEIAFSADFNSYSPPKHLIKWVPFIRAAHFQGYPAIKIAATLQAQGITAAPDDVESILQHYHRRRHAVPINDQLDSAAADIDALRSRGMSEHQVCLWLAINRDMAVHQCQLNTWARARRNKAK